MLGIYFSGTGNTEYCVKLLSSLLGEAETVSLENPSTAKKLEENDTIIFGYPVQFSNIPYFVRTFIEKNGEIWKGKQVLCLATMGAFSGDGAGCAARLLEKKGAVILGGVHVKMPDSVCDSPLLKKSFEENQQLVEKATEKIEKVASDIKRQIYPKEGLSFLAHVIGLFGQRLWFYHKTRAYTKKLNIHENCNGCGICAQNCSTQNLSLLDGKAVAGNRCTMCYRCISKCPQKAITLLGKKVVDQHVITKYV